MNKKIIKDAVEMTKRIPAKDVLVPLAQEEENLAPLPKVEYKIIEAPTMDKLVRDVNAHLANGWVCDWGVQVSSGPIARFYQSVERWNVDVNFGPESEMPSENSEAGTMRGNAILWEGMKFLENEPDLYEDITKDATDWQTN